MCDVHTVCRLAGDRERMLAVFSFTSGPSTDIISEFADTFQLPIVSVSPAFDESLRRRGGSSRGLDESQMVVHSGGRSFALHVRPLYTAAVVDVIRHYHWQHVIYVFDNADGRRHYTCRFRRITAKFRYAVWSQTGPKLVADLLARASSLLAI